MLAQMIDRIVVLAAVNKLEVAGRPYTDKKLFPVLDPEASPVPVYSLAAVADFLSPGCPDCTGAFDPTKVIVHVCSYDKVKIIGAISGPYRQRETLLVAGFNLTPYQFGKWYDIEEFIIAMQALFVQDENTAAILRIAGNLSEGVNRTHADDGVTQRVTIQAGISRVENAAVPNPVQLAPYRTFNEVAQPHSRFVFRMRESGEKGKPSCALFEADGGAWQNAAMQNIKGWLAERLPVGTMVLA